jgi:segregation and condensation protein B
VTDLEPQEPKPQASEPTPAAAESPTAGVEPSVREVDSSAPGDESTVVGVESPVGERESTGPEGESRAAEVESRAREVESTVPGVESPIGESDSPVPAVESPAGGVDSPVGEVGSSGPEGESRAAEVESSAAGVESPVGEVESAAPDVESPAPAVESSVGGGAESPAPEGESPAPGVESPAPGVESSVPEVDSAGESEAEPEADIEHSDLPPLADDADLANALEALLLVVDTPAGEELLAITLDQSVARVTETLHRMSAELADRNSGIDLRRAGDGWRFVTRDKYAPFVEKLLLDGQRAKLTRAALETLAVIAYRQPVTRSRVAAVRGVNVDGVIRTLVTRGLIRETGTDSDTGGILYRTTELFLERLGLSSLEDLPAIAPLLPEVDAIDDV